jgi:hypothetical protein
MLDWLQGVLANQKFWPAVSMLRTECVPKKLQVFMLTTSIHAGQPTANSPEDLRQLVGERGLVELALQATQIWGSNLPQGHSAAEQGFNARMLLALLTYSYAAGIYASEDVGWACESDPGARYLCANAWPDAATLRCFRRRWRPLIETCLRWVYAMSRATHSATLVEFDAPATVDVTELVQRKLELAVLMDTATCD